MDARDVERWMVAAERADSRDRQPGEIRNPGEMRPLAWIGDHVGDPRRQSALKLWIWCRAHGYSFHDVAPRRLGSYSTALRRKNQAVAEIVAGLAARATREAA